MIYQIKVQGNIDSSWSGWFDGLDISLSSGGDGSCVTTMTGLVGDQAALRGILNHLWDLNLTVLSLNPVETYGILQNPR